MPVYISTIASMGGRAAASVHMSNHKGAKFYLRFWLPAHLLHPV